MIVFMPVYSTLNPEHHSRIRVKERSAVCLQFLLQTKKSQYVIVVLEG